MKDVTWPLGIEAGLALANTIHGPGGHYRVRASASDGAHDHLDSPDRAIEFLGSHGVPLPAGSPSAGQLARLRATRDAARSLVDLEAGDLPAWSKSLHGLLAGAAFRFARDGALKATAPGWTGLTDELLVTVLTLSDEGARLASCGNPLCGWLFVDRSRNRSRVWCEMAVCGNRVKVGRFRHRKGLPVGALVEREPPR